MTSDAIPHGPVEATPEVLADLRAKADELDTGDLTRYALGLGLIPPAEPEGYLAWEIVVAFPDEDDETGVLYWLGPTPGHGEADYPTPSEQTETDSEDELSSPWD